MKDMELHAVNANSFATILLVAKLELAELVSRLSNSGRRSNGRRNRGSSRGSSRVAVDFSLGAVPRNVAGFAAAVAGLAGSVEWAAVRSGAVTGNVSYGKSVTLHRIQTTILTELATGVALHGLSLAITGEVVRSATLVASSRASAASEAAPEASITATGSASTAAHSWVGAVAGKVASDTAAVAASAGTSSAQSQRRAVSLDVSEALAVIALLRCCFVSILVGRGLSLAARLLRMCEDGSHGAAWDK